MNVAIGVDHAAFDYKAPICHLLTELGHTVLDMGAHSTVSVDYPRYAVAVAYAVRDGQVDCGIFLCGTGIGGSIAANKVSGIRAALCHEAYTARMSRTHNNANVLCLGARVVGMSLALEIVEVWLATPWSEDPRHGRRLTMITNLESGIEL